MAAANLGRLENEVGAPDLAARHFEQALEYLHTGLRPLPSAEHHDKFKSWIEDAATGLMEIYAAAPDGKSRWFHLAGLFESLRRHDLLGDSKGEAARLLEETAAGRGELAELLDALDAAFVWMQAESSVVFGIVRPGREAIVRTVPKRWMGFFELARETMQGMTERRGLRAMMERPESYQGTDAAYTIRRVMNLAFERLPAEMQELFTAPEIRTLFLSPCRQTLSFPLELLPARGTFAGLRKVLVRVRALRDLPALLRRKPDVAQGCRFLFGDPDTEHRDFPRLRQAFQAAKELEGLLADAGMAAVSSFAEDATRGMVTEALRDRALALFIFNGHGEAGSLLLARGERLSTADVDGCEWPSAPVVHLDCCSAGVARGRGGGRFSGLSTGFLQGGASAVLASFQRLFDIPSAEFTRELYDALLNGRETLGAALLRARQTMDRRYGGNPMFWYTTVLWGNPGIRLRPPEENSVICHTAV